MLNAAAIVCEGHCYAPPGFIVEEQIAFNLAENQEAYLREGLIQLPMRERSLADFAEKKRIGYEPMRNRYSGLFDDTRIGFLGNHATGIVNRKTQITRGILDQWEGGPEERKRIWTPVKKLLDANTIDLISRIPFELDQRGTAVTWSAIKPELPDSAQAASKELRDTLQHVYFGQYCREFGLVALQHVPHIPYDFALPTAPPYDYRLLSAFFDSFNLREVLLDAPAELIVALRRQPGFISLIDAYAGLADIAASPTDVAFHAGRVCGKISYGWDTLPTRRLSLYEGSHVEITELTSAMDEAASLLSRSMGLPTRNGSPDPKVTKRDLIMPQEAELVIFVALEEELDILASILGFRKVSSTPEASGTIDGIQVDVICPRNMGRVAAAVAMSRYLSKRHRRPKLILVVGLAGGFEENKTVPGHIIVVEKVVDLALRKVRDEETGVSSYFRREDYSLQDQLKNQLLSHDFDQKTWSAQAADKFEWPSDRRPSLHYGPLASADEVVASDVWRKQLLDGKGGDPKLLGVEMEAGGVCAAARKDGSPVSMLRVVSDQADPAKADDHWRKLGMKTLADLLKNASISKVIAALD
jgi:nucleoside phosphorylase